MICIRKLLESRGFKSWCRCPRCAEEKEKEKGGEK